MNVPISRRGFLWSAAGVGALGLAGCSILGRKDNVLRAGAARRKVTPPLEVPYLTSSMLGTCKAFQGFKEDLFARALVFDDGAQALAILAVDSIGYDNAVLGPGRNFTNELRQRVAAKTAIAPEAIMLAATHAHSTPETIGLSPFREVAGVQEWLENHLTALVDTVVEAWQKREPVTMRFGAREVTGLTRNRRIVLKNGKMNRHGPVPPAETIGKPFFDDEDLSVVYLETLAGNPHSVLLNFTGHPVISMLLPEISADFPGATSTMVEEHLPGAVCLFTNGAAGDINTFKVSTNHEDVEDVGRRVGEAAQTEIARLKRATPVDCPQLRVQSESKVLLPRRIDLAQHATDGSHFVRLKQKFAEGPILAEVQAMQVGPVRWVSFPGEAFVETGLSLKRQGASFVVGYANGWVGYLPTRGAYEDGGYECELGVWSRVDRGSAEILEETGARLLSRFA